MIWHCLESHCDIILTICGFLLAWYVYHKEKKDKNISLLAKQVIAYYSLEQEAVKEIQKYNPSESAKTIKIRLRTAAKENKENLEQIYPSMTAKGARRYLALFKQ